MYPSASLGNKHYLRFRSPLCALNFSSYCYYEFYVCYSLACYSFIGYVCIPKGSVKFYGFEFYINGIMYVYFCDLLFFSLVLFESHSLLLLYSFILDHNLSFLSMDIWGWSVGSVFAFANNAAMNIVYLGGILLAHVAWIFIFTG